MKLVSYDAIFTGYNFISDESSLWCQQVRRKIKQKWKKTTKTCCIKTEKCDQQLLVKDKCSWNDLYLDTKDCQPEENYEGTKRTASDVLHELADSLPFAGYVVDIYLDIPDDFNSNCEGFLSFYGALRRLKDWHNAAVVLLTNRNQSDISPDLSQNELTDLIPGIHVCDINNFEIPDEVVWRGKISVVDKTVNRGFILPGLELKHNENNKDFIIKHPRSQDEEEIAVLGRMLEVLDEVNIETIPEYFKTSNTFCLSQQYDHPHTTVFIDHIKSSQSGLLMRLTCYHGDILDTLCGDKYLNTTTWKESVIADITFIQEPEEELLPGYEYIHMVAYCKEDSQDVTMYHLRSPYQINGQIFHSIYHNTMLPVSENEADISPNFLSELPVFSQESWEEMMISLKDIQTELMKEWLNEKTKTNSPTVVKLSDLHSFLYDVQKTFLEQLKDYLPTCDIFKNHLPELQTFSELDRSPSSWSERCLLVYQESQRKSFSRLQSTDSMALSSPVQPDDVTTIDMAGFLKLFQQDGNPVATKLSPVRKRHPSRSFRLQNSSDMQKTVWPDCHYMPHFDIYYNLSKKTEKQESQNYKLREKHIKAETFTSGPATVFKLPKKKSCDSLNGKEVPTQASALCPRRSPRKSVGSKLTPPRKSAKGGLFSPRRSAGRGLLSPRKPLKQSVLLSPRKGVTKATSMLSPTRSSPRKKARADLNTSLPGISFNKPSTAVDKLRISETAKAKRRHSVGVAVLNKHKDTSGRKSLSSANDSLNTSAGSGLDDSINTQKRKESRSERHKRKLQEIVDNVLKQHGVDKDSSIYQACSTKLFKVTKLFVMDLPTSKNLKEEMKNIAEGQVQQVINLENRRQSIGGNK